MTRLILASTSSARQKLLRQAGVAFEIMRRFSDDFLAYYLGELKSDVLSSVGGYKLEGLGVQLFEAIEGDYFTIVGLPLLPLLTFLRSEGSIAS